MSAAFFAPHDEHSNVYRLSSRYSIGLSVLHCAHRNGNLISHPLRAAAPLVATVLAARPPRNRHGTTWWAASASVSGQLYRDARAGSVRLRARSLPMNAR